MDPGVAVVLGAVVALVGAVVVPWLTKALDVRAADRKSTREEQRAALLDCTRALAAVVEADEMDDPKLRRAARLKFERDAARLELALRGHDALIVPMAREAERDIGEKVLDRADIVQSFAEFSSAWYRGDMSAELSLRSYRERIREWSGEE